MFVFLVWLLAAIFGLAVLSVTGIIVAQKLFGPNPPPAIQDLHKLLMGILSASAKLILSPFELLGRFRISIGDENKDSRNLPPPNTRQLSEQ
jgi:hypothetical protein